MASAGDTKIRFTVEGINQLHQEFQKILTDSQALTKEWESQGTSIVKSLREQLELLKQRNRIASTNVSGTSSVNNIPSGVSGNEDIEAALEKMVDDGLKISKSSIQELAEILRGSVGKPEAQGAGPERGGEPSRTSEEKMGVSDGFFSRFMRGYAISNLMNVIQSNDPVQGLSGLAGNVNSALMQSGNPYAMAGGAILGVVKSLFDIKYGAVRDVAPVAAEASRVLGGDWTQYALRDENLEKYGLMRSEVLQRQMSLARAMGRQNLGENLENALFWERTTSLSAQDIASFAQSARGDSSFGIGRNLSVLMASLNRSGVNNEKIQTQMSEYLREIVSLNQMQLDRFGRADATVSTNLYTMMASAFPKIAESNPAFIGRMASSLYTGLSRPTTDQMRALRYMSNVNANPNASWFELEMMAEDPFGESVRDLSYLSPEEQQAERKRRLAATQEYLERQRGAGGDWQGFAKILQFEYGLSANVSANLARTFDFDTFIKEATTARKKKEGEDKPMAGLEGKVDSISQLLTTWEGVKLGTDVGEINTVVKEIEGVLRQAFNTDKVAERQENRERRRKDRLNRVMESGMD